MNDAVRTPKYYTIKRVAERYDVSERTVQRWIKSRRLNAHKFGKSVRISIGDLMQMEATARQSDDDFQS
jgi:excisionase family DNA binding protein